MSGNVLLRWLFATVLLAVAAPCFADSWMLPEPETYLSADRHVRLRVIPRELNSQLDYFEDKLHHKEPAGQRPGSGQTSARGILERLGPGGRWLPAWDRALANEVAPVGVLIADGGRNVVTFNDWHSVGYGPNAVVIYAADGRLVRALSLRQILPQVYIDALPHSVSSIWWRGEARFSPDGQTLIVQILMPDDSDDASRNPSYVDRRIRLSDGAVLEDKSLYWARVLMQADSVANARKFAEQVRKNFFLSPLRGPVPPTEEGWHNYLREAFYRLDPRVSFDWDKEGGSYVRTTVLRDPLDPEYAVSEGWLRDALTKERDPDDVAAIASLSSPEHFLITMDHIAARAPNNVLKGTRTYVAIPAAYRQRTMAILARTVTRVICLDPSVPIPQRPERLKQFQEAGN